jgi:histidine triad (HIT) family protein
MTDTVFQQIIDKNIPADIIFEDDLCIAFNDINPQAPHHILLIPKKSISQLSQAKPEDKDLLGHLLLTAHKIANEKGIGDGYRVIINNGEKGGQTVFHLHVHLIGGRQLNWPNL